MKLYPFVTASCLDGWHPYSPTRHSSTGCKIWTQRFKLWSYINQVFVQLTALTVPWLIFVG